MSHKRIALFLTLGSLLAPAATAQVAYVNTDLILQRTPGYGTADSILAAERAVFQREADVLQAQLDSGMTAFEQQRLVLSPQAREERADALRDLNQRVQTRIQEMQNAVLERQRELVEPLERRISTVIDGIRAERNIGIIFDVANPNSTIISADPALDLTALVIRRLQNVEPGPR